jgi:hypothetical protein
MAMAGAQSARRMRQLWASSFFKGMPSGYGPPSPSGDLIYRADDQRVYSIYILWSSAFLR